MQYLLNWSNRYYWRHIWNTFTGIWATHFRRDELTRLIQWAERKRLIDPLRLYEKRLVEEEQRLFSYQIRHPRLLKLVRNLYPFAKQIKGEPTYYKKGSAAKYRYT